MAKEISHKERAHAKLSASGSATWLNCPGSVKAQEPYPDTSSIYADEGTIAHEVADICLSTNNDAESYIGRTLKSLKIKVDSYESTFKIHKEMAENVQEYLDYVRSHETNNSLLFTEERVDFSNVVPDGFGTMDAAVLDYENRILHIFDLKYGSGVLVEAFENTQGQMYAIGILNELGFLDAFDTIRIHIVQPRKNNFSSWDVTVDELKIFSKWVAERADLALSSNAPRVPGDKQCQWCDARADCTALKDFTEDLIKTKFKDMEDAPCNSKNLTAEDKALILRHKKLITKFIKDIEDSVYEELSSGKSFPGMKLVRGSANRVFPPESEMILVERLGEDAYTKKLIGIGAAEKLLGKKEVEPLTIKPEGKLVMVSEDDKRPEVKMENTMETFNNME